MLAMALSVHADEVQENSAVQNPATPMVNFEQLIAQARKEEKDKLYPRIQKLEEENKQLVSQGNANLLKIGDLTEALTKAQTELQKYTSGEKTAEEVTKLNKQVTDLTAEIERLKAETPNVEELRAKFEKEYEVKAYIAEQRQANKDSIITSFLDEISGSTKEEVDESVKNVQAKSNAIKKELGLVDDEGNPVQQKSPSGSKKQTKRSNAPVGNPTEDSGVNKVQIDADYIRGLDPTSDEYKEFRKKIGLK